MGDTHLQFTDLQFLNSDLQHMYAKITMDAGLQNEKIAPNHKKFGQVSKLSEVEHILTLECRIFI